MRAQYHLFFLCVLYGGFFSAWVSFFHCCAAFVLVFVFAWTLREEEQKKENRNGNHLLLILVHHFYIVW